MIEFVKGNMFEYPGLHVITNTVNCVGVMGKGIALEFKKRFPDYYQAYKAWCRNGHVKPGSCHIYLFNWPVICSIATKDHWRDPSQIEWIQNGLRELKQYLLSLGEDWPVIGMPALGCNNGGLSWTDVKPLIEKELGDIPNRVVVFEPLEGTYEQVIHTNKGAMETSEHTP